MIAITMRQERISYPSGNEETRDCLACGWWDFLHRALPANSFAPLPNLGDRICHYLQSLPQIEGVIFSGGDDWGKFPLRDATETALFTLARSRGWPMLGVCRGAQVINRLLGGACSGLGHAHVNARHDLIVNDNAPIRECPRGINVNSYHANGILEQNLAAGLDAWAYAADGSVEAFANAAEKTYGIMWHPEREAESAKRDIDMFRHIFGGNQA